MWIVFALLAPFFFAIVHVLDEYCVDHVLEKPWMGVVTSSLASIVLYLAFPFVLPWTDLSGITFEVVLLGFLVGVFIQTSQAFYFHALSFSDAGIVAAYWNLIPFILPIVSFFIFGQLLAPEEYLGIVLLIMASTLMCLLDYHQKTRFLTFALMFLAAVFQVIAYLIMGKIYHAADFFLVYFCVGSGIIFSGLVPLLFPKPRRAFKVALKKIHPAIKFFVWIEIANLLALASAQFAISLGDPSLVAAVETTVPAFVFLVSVYWIAATKVSNTAIWSKVPAKFLVIAIMALGVWLVS